MVKGRFIGQDGSCGFRHGEIYTLTTSIRPIVGQCICLQDRKTGNWCPYSSLEAVLENWEFNVGHNKIKPLD